MRMMGSDRTKSAVIPDARSMGRNAPTVVRVAVRSGTRSSFTAALAASKGASPRSSRAWMASTTTMALSTIIPSAMTMAATDICSRTPPPRWSIARVLSAMSGTTAPTIQAARPLRKRTRTAPRMSTPIAKDPVSPRSRAST